MIWTVLELRMAAHQPQDGVGPVLAPRDRGVAGALLAFGLRQAHLGVGKLQGALGVGLGLLDFLAGELPGQDGVEALDALGGVPIGDRLYFERVQLAEIGDLVERQRGVFHKPDRGGFRHQRLDRHGKISLCSARPWGEA
jgi:hypothetical protein